VKLRLKLFNALAIAAVLVANVLPAHATFPGKNGRIAFIQGPDVYTMNPDGSDVRQLTSLTNGNSSFWATWSADGRQIVFSEFPPPDGFGQLWMMNADGSNQHLLLSDPGYDDEAPSFSPDGTYVVFASCTSFHNEFPCVIKRVQTDGSGLTALTLLHIERGDFYPAYSPDGNAIAFGSFGRDGVIAGLYLMNPDGSDVRSLTIPEISAFLPDWSPNGTTLAFSSHCCNPELPSLYAERADIRRMQRLTHNQGFIDLAPSWSPQGDAIVFERNDVVDGSSGIWVIGIDGSGEKLIRKVQPATFHRSHPESIGRNQRPRKQRPSHEIQNGGSLPRWGVAQ